MLIISPTARISPLADLEDSVRGSEIRIEDGAVIDSFVKLKPAGGNGNVRIGRNCSINSTMRSKTARCTGWAMT